MPLFIAVSMIEDAAAGRIFNDVRAFVLPDQDAAVEQAKAEVSKHHPGKTMLTGSIIGITPETVREAYAELATSGGLQ